MTSIERVRATLKFDEPDKVPLGHYAIDCDIAARVLGRPTFIRDKAGTQIALWEGRRDEVVARLITDIPELFRKLDIFDIVSLHKVAMVPPKDYQPEAPKKIGEGLWEDKAGCVYKFSAVTNEIACVHDPVKWEGEFTLEDFDLNPEVGPEDDSIYEVIDAVLPQLPADKYLLGPFPQGPTQVLLGGYERGLIEIADHPEVVKRAVHAGMARARKQQALWKNRPWHGVMHENDFGHTTGPFVSPITFRELFQPGLKFNVESAHARGLDFILHSCGDNRQLIDQFVEAGIDCLQSLQPQAGMSPALVKDMSDNRIAAWGGVDVANLIAGSPESVRADVRRAVTTAKSGGGFILGASHSIAWGTQYDNFMALLDEFDKLRDY